MERHPYLSLSILTLLALGPFVAKPFNIDDPLFIWAAKHIQAHPFNPYDFTVNWYGNPMPMWEVTKNPPLACYYIAIAGSLLGWSEVALHCTFLLPAIAVVLGTYRLARHFCDQALFTAATTLFMPVFLVSATSVMCDVLMLAFWVWATVFWLEGLEGNISKLLTSALLMLLAASTKYFGMCLIPLLVVYAWLKCRKLMPWAACLMIPIAGLAAYQWITLHLYGRGLLTDAGNYAVDFNPWERAQMLGRILKALAFTGGCAAIVTFVAPYLWRGKMLWGIVLFVAILSLTLFSAAFWEKYSYFTSMSHKGVGFQTFFWAIGGASVLLLAGIEIKQKWDARSALLALWIVGTFFFAGFVNWTVNGRSILPLAPAAAILLVRRIEHPLNLPSQDRKGIRFPILVVSVMAAILGLVVTRADYKFAQAARLEAQLIASRYKTQGQLWYLGHWGWQYYIENTTAKAYLAGQPPAAKGDFIAVPINNVNTGIQTPDSQEVAELAMYKGEWLAIVNGNMGAGFYSSMFGPVPFAFGNSASDTVCVYKFTGN